MQYLQREKKRLFLRAASIINARLAKQRARVSAGACVTVEARPLEAPHPRSHAIARNGHGTLNACLSAHIAELSELLNG